jgi:hypothetical protein
MRAGFRPPSPAAIAADREALEGGERLIVTCGLRGSAPPYPTRLRQGELELAQEEIRWRAFWSLGRTPLVIDTPIRSIEVRAAEQRERNVKKGGKAFVLIPIPEFKVIEATTDSGAIEFVVPSWDVPLVVFALHGDS